MDFKKLNTPRSSPSFPNDGLLVLRFQHFFIIRFISMYRYKRLTNSLSSGNEGHEGSRAIPLWKTMWYSLTLLWHLFFLIFPVTYPYPSHNISITHLINDMGYRWDMGGISMGYLRNILKRVMDRWQYPGLKGPDKSGSTLRFDLREGRGILK